MSKKRLIQTLAMCCLVILILFACYLIYLYQHPIWEGKSKNWSGRYYYTLPMKRYTGRLYWRGSKKITVTQTTFYKNNKRATNANDTIAVRKSVGFVEQDAQPSPDTSILIVFVKWKKDGKKYSELINLHRKRIYKPYYIFSVN
ncbi:hypothetical protein ABWW58_01330 [Sporolactobacillus sp. STCC-11]|uniref:hypothetical protein n=1 Tax=Sporolactobacillus caesalpiniae TaxID=3230362 RepID=UPI003399338A